jgi:hypothetical protein
VKMALISSEHLLTLRLLDRGVNYLCRRLLQPSAETYVA